VAQDDHRDGILTDQDVPLADAPLWRRRDRRAVDLDENLLPQPASRNFGVAALPAWALART